LRVVNSFLRPTFCKSILIPAATGARMAKRLKKAEGGDLKSQRRERHFAPLNHLRFYSKQHTSSSTISLRGIASKAFKLNAGSQIITCEESTAICDESAQ
jgi:hypothetical protein